MKRTEAIDYIVNRPYDHLQKARRGNTYICPLCGSGTGEHGTGMSTKDGKHFTCWSCKEIMNSDIIDIIGKENKLTTFSESFDKACEDYGIQADKFTTAEEDFFPEDRKAKGPAGAPEVPRADYRAYIEKAVKALHDNARALQYLHSRGLSDATIEKQRIGYEEDHGHPYIVIPYSDHYYIKRRTDTNEGGEKYRKPRSEEAGPEPLYNAQAIQGSDPVFIVEGTFCAMSIMQAGQKAIALNTTGDPKNLIGALERSKDSFTGSFVVCLDNDKNNAGQEGQRKLIAELDRLHFTYIEDNIADECKDPNDLLQKDPDRFYGNVAKATQKARAALYGDIMGDNVEIYARDSFESDIEVFKDGQSIVTGFSCLDRLTGGLYSGLYVLGAISSLGKTTFMHQMADQLAERGRRVVYFSLEQSKMELLSKSLAREVYKDTFDETVSSLQIRKGGLPDLQIYRDSYLKIVGDRLTIVEGNMTTDIEEMKNYVKRYIDCYGVRPIVMIDYLQIIQNNQERDAKAKVDANVKALKIMSRELDVTVICISNLNRANYTLPVDFESFKESGLIEYSADVVWGLQLEVITLPSFIYAHDSLKSQKENNVVVKRDMVKAALSESPRKIKLVCLKNRYGGRYEVSLRYHPRVDYLSDEESWQPGAGAPFSQDDREEY